MKALRALAAKYPGVDEGVACKGTALESSTFGVKKKAFLFLADAREPCTVRLKLAKSVAEARKLAAQDPARYAIGAGGWAKLTFPAADPPPLELLKRWVDESYRVVTGAHKKKRK